MEGEERRRCPLATGLSASMRNLQKTRVGSPYRARMLRAWRPFVAWCKLRGIHAPSCFLSAGPANDLLVIYIQLIFSRHEDFNQAKYLVLYVQTRWRHLKGKLRKSWDSVESWSSELPTGNRIPMPLVVHESLCQTAFLHAASLLHKSVAQAYMFVAMNVLSVWGLQGSSGL